MRRLARNLLPGTFALVMGACVTTQQIADRSPDPRDDLPALTSADQAALATKKRAERAAAHPLRTVIATSAHDPIVNVRVVFEAGSADDPAGKEGLAMLSASLMREATEKLTAAKLQETLFPWAAELGVQVDKDTTVFMGRVHKDHESEWGDVLLDVILHPRLDKGDFERKRAEQKAFIENTLRTGNDELLQREALETALYPPGHPYHHTPWGTVKGLDSITLDDVHAFIAQNLTYDRVVLGVSGGADDALVKKLEAGLSSLPFSTAPRAAVKTPALPMKNVAELIDKPAAGTAISIGYVLPELSRTSPDYAAMKLAETWFGEHRSLIGHLFDAMREKRGLNYGDYAYIEHFRQAGWGTFEQLNIPRRTQYFSMWIRPVEHKNRLFALRQTAYELDKFARFGIPDDESFERARSYVQGYWRAKEAEPMRRLGYQMDTAMSGSISREQLRKAVARLTRAEVNAAIKRHLHPGSETIVVVTEKADALKAAIDKGDASPISYASSKVPKEQKDEDKIIEVFDLGLAPDRIHVVPPSALFEE